ncbi:MAG: DUF3800 domain-containing protein [Alphaproteobacteria bacterium]|nr:DUF3800 domain-containing protein [Alphaproteobacteria bacterium]MBP3687084.1 DUF3800 domain-containing protein [Alphaproteobacteria bacterium]
MPRQLVFIDESGDPGFDIAHGASSYFVIAVVIFNSMDAVNSMITGIEDLKRELNIHDELKFSKASHENRLKYIETINKYTFFSKIIVVNKNIITSHDLRNKPRLFYNFILKQVLTHSPILEAKVILDGKGNKHFRDELKSYLKRENDNKIKDFSLKDSKKDCLVQVADTIASAIAWGYKNNNPIYEKSFNKNKIHIWEFK